MVGLFAVPLVWGIGPIGLAFVWLALDAAKFGLVVFAGLYLVIVLIRWRWQDLL
jgi:hypothetical protein